VPYESSPVSLAVVLFPAFTVIRCWIGAFGVDPEEKRTEVPKFCYNVEVGLPELGKLKKIFEP
jgi:hypothetical protein